MVGDAEDDMDRAQLVAARKELMRQLDILMNPIRGRDSNPGLIARLRAMIDDIDSLLGETGAQPNFSITASDSS